MQRVKFEILILTLLTGVTYALAHTFNGFIFRLFEFSNHISWIYLPAFLRLANVLILGSLFGSAATAIGVIIICLFGRDTVDVTTLNTAASVIGPLISFQIFKILRGREVYITQLRDLFVLTVIYSFINALTHHLAWALVEPDQFLSVSQLPIMIVGDLVGASLGAILFAAIANNAVIMDFVKKRAGK